MFKLVFGLFNFIVDFYKSFFLLLVNLFCNKPYSLMRFIFTAVYSCLVDAIPFCLPELFLFLLDWLLSSILYIQGFVTWRFSNTLMIFCCSFIFTNRGLGWLQDIFEIGVWVAVYLLNGRAGCGPGHLGKKHLPGQLP